MKYVIVSGFALNVAAMIVCSRRWLPPTLLACLWVIFHAPVFAAADSAEADLFVQGNIEFVLLHELGHILIQDLDIPIIGPEESAADYIAAMVLIRPERFGNDRADRARSFAVTAARGFAGGWDVDRPAISSLPYWDAHALTIQRFYQISCLLYGANESTFSKLPQRIGMPAPRAARCAHEFARAERGVQWLVDTYGRHEIPESKHESQIYFSLPENRAGQRAVKAVADAQIIENTMSRLHARFELQAPVKINIQACGRVQAAWDGPTRVLTLCHELFEYYYMLAIQPAVIEKRSVFDAPRVDQPR